MNDETKPKKKPQRKRTNLIQIYVNDVELKHIKDCEKQASISRSQIIRSLLMGETVTSMTDVQTLSSLRKLGGLFKHALNNLKGRDDIDFLRQATDDLMIIIKNINKVVKGNDSKKN